MLYSTITGNSLLVCSSVEETDIQSIPSVSYSRKEDRIRVSLRVIIILTVTSKAAEEDSVILIIPLVDSEEDVP